MSTESVECIEASLEGILPSVECIARGVRERERDNMAMRSSVYSAVSSVKLAVCESESETTWL